jgi:hypothetical protein
LGRSSAAAVHKIAGSVVAAALIGLGAVGTFYGLDVTRGRADGGNGCDTDQKKKDETAAGGRAGRFRFD